MAPLSSQLFGLERLSPQSLCHFSPLQQQGSNSPGCVGCVCMEGSAWGSAQPS